LLIGLRRGALMTIAMLIGWLFCRLSGRDYADPPGFRQW
jgi:hypothetical protein